MNDFFSNKLRLLKFILLSIALGNFFISEGYATTKSVVITQQEKTVKGKVTDDNDEPLIGVSVRVAGTSAGTVTDSDGMFQLNIAGTDVLEFSYVGYKTVKVTAGNKPFLSVILKEDQEILDEIVVVGYGTKRKGSIAAAVTTIGTEDIARTTSSTVSGALVGKIAGITTRQKSGQPGSGTSIQIRNMGTPLFVIDGIIKDEAQFNNLDVNDIENISILKDGAAAIYGVKAANGVVLVTTKNGSKNQKAAVTLDFNYSWQSWTSYPRMLNAYEWQYANYMKEANLGTLSVSPDVARAELEKWRTGYYNPETGEDYRGFDWGDNYVSNAAPQSYIHANLSGGGNKTTYYLSISNIDQDAVFKDYNFQRTNIQSNFNIDISEKLKLGFRLNGRLENRTNPALPGSDDYANARQAVFNLPPIYRPYANDNPNYLNNVPGASGLNLAALTTDNAGKSDNNTTVVQIDWDMEWKTPIKGLTGKGIFSYWTSQNKVNNLEKGWKEYTYDRAADEYIVAYDKSAANETWMERFDTTIKEFSGQFLLNYDNMFGKHHVTGVGGFEFTKRDYHSLNVQQHPVENEFIDLISTNDNNLVSENKAITSTASWVFRAGYDYENRYILDLSARYDGSWKFPKGNRWGFFPSVSLGWRPTEESFMEFYKEKIGDLKLRASYGILGSQAIGTYDRFTVYDVYDNSYAYNNKTVSGAGFKLGLENLTWEKTQTFNIGVDASFLQNSLTVTFDYFHKRTNDILMKPLISSVFGTEMPMANIGKMQNQGWDLSVNYRLKTGAFTHNFNFNLGDSWNKVLEFPGDEQITQVEELSRIIRVGVPLNSYYGYKMAGFFQSYDEIEASAIPVGAKVQPGDIKFVDRNDDGIIDSKDKFILGNAFPRYTFGFTYGLNWKGIDFSMFWQGVGKRDMMLRGELIEPYHANYSYTIYKHQLDFWTPTNTEARWPRLAAPGSDSNRNNYGNGNGSDLFLLDGKYLRLKNLTIGYTLPKEWTKHLGMQKARLYINGQNLLTFSNNSFIDPESSEFDSKMSTSGANSGRSYPTLRYFGFGVDIEF